MADDQLEASTTSVSSTKKHKEKNGESKKKDKRQSTVPLLEATTFSSEFSSDVDEASRELTVGDIVIRSDFADLTADEQAATVLERFNHNVEKSAFTHNPALGRALERVDVSYFVLGHRNQNAELFDPRGQRYSTVFTADPKQEIKSLGPVLKTQPYIRAFGKHVLNVPAGHYARGFSKNRYARKRGKEEEVSPIFFFFFFFFSGDRRGQERLFVAANLKNRKQTPLFLLPFPSLTKTISSIPLTTHPRIVSYNHTPLKRTILPSFPSPFPLCAPKS